MDRKGKEDMNLHEEMFLIYQTLEHVRKAIENVDRIFAANDDHPEDVAVNLARASERLRDAQNLLFEARDLVGVYLYK